MSDKPTSKIEKVDLVVKRIIDAPIEKVWKAWTDPDWVKRWWGPANYTSPMAKVDLKVGGKFLFCMRAPKDQGGQDSYTAGIFQKIVPQERLEFTTTFADKDGNPISPQQAGLPAEVPMEFRTLIAMQKIRDTGLTELTWVEYGWPVSQMYVYSIAGCHQSIDKLAESLK
jgi:uncharacterized protein YndB with AHSA1/START domain